MCNGFFTSPLRSTTLGRLRLTRVRHGAGHTWGFDEINVLDQRYAERGIGGRSCKQVVPTRRNSPVSPPFERVCRAHHNR